MSYSKTELQQMIRNEIPLCEAMDLSVEFLSAEKIVITAPMQANVNTHGSFFAGSIYSLAAITGWGLLTNFVHHNYPGSDVVVRNASIQYIHPIRESVVRLICNLPDPEIISLFEKHLLQHGRTRLEMAIKINSRDRLAVNYNGTYTILKKGYSEITKADECS